MTDRRGGTSCLLAIRADPVPAPFHSRVHVPSHPVQSPQTSPWPPLQRHWRQLVSHGEISKIPGLQELPVLPAMTCPQDHVPGLRLFGAYASTTGIPIRHKTNVIQRNPPNKQCKICVSLGQSHHLLVSCMSDTWALLRRLCRIETGPDKSGRLSHIKFPRAPSTDLMETFSVSFASPECSFLIFPRGTKSRLLKKAGCPTRTDPSAACYNISATEFHLSHLPTTKCETFLQLRNCLFPRLRLLHQQCHRRPLQ